MRKSELPRGLSTVLLCGVLIALLGGGTTAVIAASGDPPHILFAGEVVSDPTYSHVVVLYDKRLDERVPIPLDDFAITVGGFPYHPVSASYLLSGLAGLFDESGSTFVRLQLPTGINIGASTDFQVTYARLSSAPIRDLSLTPAAEETVQGQVPDLGAFAFLGALIDSGNASNRLTLVFTGQVDLGSIPAPAAFDVVVGGQPDHVTAVEPRVPDIGLGLVDLVLESPVRHGAVVDMSYLGSPTPLKARHGGLVLDPFSQAGVTVLVPPTFASDTLDPGQTLETAPGDATPADPLITAVTSPNAGQVIIDEAPTQPAPAGYTFFGQQVSITAPPASTNSPLVLVFSIDATLIPDGADQSSVVVLRNGVPIDGCPGSVQAIPTPCITNRQAIGGPPPDIRITVNTAAASTWNFAIVTPYAFGGFRPPVDGLPVRNLAKAGSAIPIRFSLGGDRGMAIFMSGSPISQAGCNSSAPLDPIEETVTAGASSLTYDRGADMYTYVWKTNSAWAATCRTLALSFGDGTRQTALFQFK